VALYINKPDGEVSRTKDSIITTLQSIIANSSVTVAIEGIRPVPDNRYTYARMECTDSSVAETISVIVLMFQYLIVWAKVISIICITKYTDM